MKIKIPILVLSLCLLLSVPISAASLSPALDVISASRRMIRAADGSVLEFSAADFDRYFGCRVLSLTVTALPEATCGSLSLGALPISKSQTVSRDYLDMLRFTPAGKEFTESAFSFGVLTENGSYRSVCALLPSAGDNRAPDAQGLDPSQLSVGAKSGIDYFGKLYALDPENDSVDFRICDYPQNAVLTLCDKNSGAFMLSPADGFEGSDSFSYTARDEYGNISEPITVSVEITGSSDDLFYSDLGDHWAHTSAIRMTELGIMSGCVKSGLRFFEGGKEMTFSSFVTAAMKAMGEDLDELVGVETPFWDNEDIPKQDIAYIAEAAKLGFIEAKENEGRVCIDPNREITRAEAALILSRMIDCSQPLTRAVFADETSIPSEALEAVYLMNSLGVMNGTGNTNFAANEQVTRAQAAVMLDKIISINTKE